MSARKRPSEYAAFGAPQRNQRPPPLYLGGPLRKRWGPALTQCVLYSGKYEGSAPRHVDKRPRARGGLDLTLVKYVDTTRVHSARLSRQICMYRIVRRSTTLLPLPTQRHSAQPWPAGSTCTHTSQSHSQVLSMETAWTPSVEGPDSGMHMLCKLEPRRLRTRIWGVAGLLFHRRALDSGVHPSVRSTRAS